MNEDFSKKQHRFVFTLFSNGNSIKNGHHALYKSFGKVQIFRKPTLESFSLGNTNTIDHFILGEDRLHGHLLFEMFTSKFDFVGNGSAIQLDFHDMGLLLALSKELLLGVANNTDNRAVFLDLVKILFDFLFAKFIFPFLAGLSKGLLFRLRPRQ